MKWLKKLVPILAVLLIVITPILAIAADFSVTTYNEDATFIQSSGSTYARYIFYDEGRHWVFYTDGTNIHHRTTDDGGTTWSPEFTDRVEGQIFHIAFWFDGTYIHYVWANEGASGTVKYRRGEFVSDNTITWSAAEQTAVAADGTKYYMGANIATDSSGNVYISYGKSDSYAYASKNANSDGTWSTAANWPKQLGSTTSGKTYTSVVPLDSGRVMFNWTYHNAYQLRTRVWCEDNSTMRYQKLSQGTVRSYIGWSTLAQGFVEDAWLAYSQQTSNDLEFEQFDYSDYQWESRAQIYAAAGTTVAPSIGWDRASDNIFVFYTQVPDDDHVYYKMYEDDDDTWSAATQIIADEVGCSHYGTSCQYVDSNGYLCATWQKDAASPYTLRFWGKDIATVPTVTTGAATSVEEESATLNGNITSTGGDTPTIRGFEWDTDSGAPYANDWHEHGSFSTGAFTHALSGLDEGELYYYRAYATNGDGTAYGAEQTFLTKPDEPTNFNVVTENCSHLYMTWTMGDGADNVSVRALEGAYPAADRSDGVEIYHGTGTECYHHALDTGDHWYYRIWSWCGEGGLERYSDAYGQDHEVVTCIPPDCPVSLTATAGASDNVLLVCVAGAGTDNIIIVRRINEYPATMADGEIVYNGTGLTYTDNAPNLDEVEYYYRVWAWNPDGYSPCYAEDFVGGEDMADAISVLGVFIFFGIGVAANALAYAQKRWWLAGILVMVWIGMAVFAATEATAVGVGVMGAWRILSYISGLMALVSIGEAWLVYQHTRPEKEPEETMEQRNEKRMNSNLANTFRNKRFKDSY